MLPKPEESILADGSVAIRPFRAAEAEAVYAAVRESQADVAPWLPSLNADPTLAGVRAFIEGSGASAATRCCLR